MLLLDARTRVIDGITVFPDHADPEMWYYMPTAPHLSVVQDAAAGVERPQFLLIGYRGDAGTGGFLEFDVNVGAPQDVLDAVARKIADAEHLARAPSLAPVPLVDGSVRLMMLGKSSASLNPTPTPSPSPTPAPTPAGPEFVLAIDNYAKPALYGDNQAAFSVRLDAAGYQTVLNCLDAQIMPAAVIYSLDFLGLRPAYSIRIAVDWDRVQHHLDDHFGASFLVFSTEIDKAVDELVDKRVIDLQADTFVAEGADSSGVIDRRDAALAQVRAMITDTFFTSSIPPWTPEKKSDWEKAVDAAAKFAAAGVIAGATGGTGGVAAFSFKHTDITRIDRKQLNVNFAERVTVRKSIYPQGHLAGLFAPVGGSTLPREDFVREVTLDSDWFRNRTINFSTNADFDTSGIERVTVRADYAGRVKNVNLTKGTPTATLTWLSATENGRRVEAIDCIPEVWFQDWNALERPASLAGPVERRDDNEYRVRVGDLFSIDQVTVRAEGVPWDRYNAIVVELRHEGAPSPSDGARRVRQHDTLRLDKDNATLTWPMFVLPGQDNGFEVRITYHEADGGAVVREWQRWVDDDVTLRDPYPSRRAVEFRPALDWDQVAQAYIDCRYEDPSNAILEEQSLTLMKGSPNPTFTVALHDPTRRAVSYKVSISYLDGRFEEQPTSMTEERAIPVRTGAKGRMIVTIHAPDNFAQTSLKQVTVELRFDDLAGGTHAADTVTLDGPDARGRFEYTYSDEAARRYEYCATFLYANGLTQATDWTAADATDLTPAMP